MDYAELEKIGLNKNEAKVYIELARLGQATAGELIKKTEFHRNIVYDNLEKLIDKGLVSFITEGRRKIFQINPPDMLTDFLDKEQEVLDDKKKIAEKIKKEVKKQFDIIKEKQESIIMRGVKGVKLVMKEIIDKNYEYISFGAPEESNEVMGKHFWIGVARKMKEQNQSVKLLFNESLRYWGETLHDELDYGSKEIKYLDFPTEPITQTLVYGSKVAVVVWTEKPIVTLIDNQAVADSYREFFKVLWSQAKD
ncbi:hypothetical protein KY348_05265 [Candidatus Woesearchaeota archaeon]|nr:hypothetical protein [Candidatus Woesearchaeota archaeon]